MPISIDQLPYDTSGGLEGTWLFQLRQNLNGGHGGAEFRDGRTVTPVDARTFKKFVATMGNDIVGAYRQSDDTALGDVSTLRPESFDELASKSLAEQDSNKLAADAENAARLKQSEDDAVIQHARAGAKFETPEKQARRKAFEEAAGRSVKETTEGDTTSVVGEGQTPDGGKVIEGGEPALTTDATQSTSDADAKRNALIGTPNATPDTRVDTHADTSTDTTTGKKKRW